MRRHTSLQHFPTVRKRFVSVSELEGDTVVDAMAKLEVRRLFQQQAKSMVKQALEDRSPDLPRKAASHLRFSRAPARVKPVQSPGSTLRAVSTRTSPTRYFRPPVSKPTSPKWVSPFTLRGIPVLSKPSSRASLLLTPHTAQGNSRQRLWTGTQRWWEGDLPLGGLLRRKMLKTLSASPAITSN